MGSDAAIITATKTSVAPNEKVTLIPNFKVRGLLHTTDGSVAGGNSFAGGGCSGTNKIYIFNSQASAMIWTAPSTTGAVKFFAATAQGYGTLHRTEFTINVVASSTKSPTKASSTKSPTKASSTKSPTKASSTKSPTVLADSSAQRIFCSFSFLILQSFIIVK